MGLLSALAHLLVISAFRYAEASVLSPLAYFELVTATVIGFVVFSEFPGISSWLGTALIVLGGLLISLGRDQGGTLGIGCRKELRGSGKGRAEK